MSVRKPWAGLVAALAMVLLPAGPSFAQTAEQEALALTITQTMFRLIDVKASISSGAAASIATADFLKQTRPEWGPLFIDALNEEVDADEPQIEAMFAHALAKNFTADELKAGVTVLNDPTMELVFQAAAKHQPLPQHTGQPCARDCMKAMSSPAGASFMRKFGNLGTILDAKMTRDIVIVIVPGMFTRFGEKAKAYELAHKSGG